MSTDRTGCGLPRLADAGREMTVYGWVDRRRDHGGLIFLDIRDHSGILQVVINPRRRPTRTPTPTACGSSTYARARHPAGARGRTTSTPAATPARWSCTLTSARCFRSQHPPFPVNEETDVEEGLRLRHR